MTRLLGISGSLRAASYNTALLRAARDLVPDGVELDIATLHGIPLYDGDLEGKEGIPDAVAALKEKVAACDGLILCTPEYNHSVPGVLKNAVDWLSRPNTDIPRVFGGRPVALLGASPARFGTVLAQNAWLPVFRLFGVRYWSGMELMVGGAHKAFDDQGQLQDDEVRKLLAKHLAGFTDFVRS